VEDGMSRPYSRRGHQRNGLPGIPPIREKVAVEREDDNVFLEIGRKLTVVDC